MIVKMIQDLRKRMEAKIEKIQEMDYKVHGILQARILEFVAFPFSRASNPGMEPSSSTQQADSLPAEPQGKPKNTGVGSLSLLQQIFPI